MGIVKLSGYSCERCSHLWVPRSKVDDLPIICPKCKSPYWNTPRGTKKSEKVSLNKLVK